MSEAQSAPTTPSAQPAAPSTSIPAAPATPPPETKKNSKKPRSAAQLAALAKGREKRTMNVKEQKASKSRARSVVKHEESANELIEKVKEELPEATVTKRKRKKHDTYDEVNEPAGGYGMNASTALKVGGIAAVAGLAYLGLKNGGLPMPTFTAPNFGNPCSRPRNIGTDGFSRAPPVSAFGNP